MKNEKGKCKPKATALQQRASRRLAGARPGAHAAPSSTPVLPPRSQRGLPVGSSQDSFALADIFLGLKTGFSLLL